MCAFQGYQGSLSGLNPVESFALARPPLTVSVPFSIQIAFFPIEPSPRPDKRKMKTCVCGALWFSSQTFPVFVFLPPPYPVYTRKVVRPNTSPFPGVAIRGQGPSIRLPPLFLRAYYFNRLTNQEVKSAGKSGSYEDVKSTGRNCQGGYLPFFSSRSLLIPAFPFSSSFLFLTFIEGAARTAYKAGPAGTARTAEKAWSAGTARTSGRARKV